jgi:predicted secreted protein
MKRVIPVFLFWTITLLLTGAAAASDDPLTYDRVNLSVGVTEEVANDTLVAELYSQREGEDAASLSSDVNRAISWAADVVAKYPAIKSQTASYSTVPVYRDQKLVGWRVRQSIRLESRDSADLSRLIGQLQEQLSVGRIDFVISPGARREAEDRLIARALAAFKTRAALVTTELGRSDYRLVEVNIENGGITPRPLMRAMAAEPALAPPSLEPGTRKLQVTVSGVIELRVK